MNVGIVGIRGFGSTYLKTIAGRAGDRVTALCDWDERAVADLADQHGVVGRFSSLEKMLAEADVGAVFIATPHFLHHPMVMKALAAGKHVLCEKPLAIRAEHADEMARTARAKGLVLTCHYNQRTRSYVVALRQIIQSGLIGQPYQINARWMARWTEFMFDERTNWRLDRAKSGGGIFVGRGSHLIDAVLYMLGWPAVEEVSATVSGHLTGDKVDDFATATLRLAGGVALNVQCSYVAHAAAYADRMEYEIFASQGGAAYSSGQEVTVGRTSLKDGSWDDLSAVLDREAIAKASAVTVVGDFLDAIAEGRDPLVTGEQAADVTRVIEAGYRSAGY